MNREEKIASRIVEKVADLRFEPSRMMRYIKDAHLYEKFLQMSHSMGEESAMRKLYDTEVSGNAGHVMQYMRASDRTASVERVAWGSRYTDEAQKMKKEIMDIYQELKRMSNGSDRLTEKVEREVMHGLAEALKGMEDLVVILVGRDTEGDMGYRV